VNNLEAPARPALFADVTAVLLAGGQSRRMGRDKALLCMEGLPVAQLLAKRLQALTDEVLLSTNNPAAYTFLGLKTISDIHVGGGPLAGLHAALVHTQRPLVLLVACDLPGVPEFLLRRLVECSVGYDAVIPCTSNGRLHPVCAIYNRTCLPAIERNLMRGEHQMLAIFHESLLRVRQLTPGEGGFSDHHLLDMNSPEDFEECQRLHKS
jgi:molybdopterin-guanine dinucleotide biosynthesis protein A